MKKKISDFAFAFVLSMIVFSSLVILCTEGTDGGIFSVGETKDGVRIFETRFVPDPNVRTALTELFEYNRIFFGSGGIGFIKASAEYVFSFFIDALNMVFLLLKDIMGVV